MRTCEWSGRTSSARELRTTVTTQESMVMEVGKDMDGRHETVESEQALNRPGSALDRLTEAVATRISRRTALSVGLGGTVGSLLGAARTRLLHPLTAFAGDCGTPGSRCCNSLCRHYGTPWT